MNKKGERVTIFNRNMRGEQITEGTAVLIKLLKSCDNEEYWRVKFENGFVTERWIKAYYQGKKK